MSNIAAKTMPDSHPSHSARLVTLVSCDLVESTSHEHQLGPEAYKLAFDRFDDIVRQSVEAEHGTQIVEDTGDGCLIEAGRPSSAVRVALRIQHGVKSTNWGEHPLQVRIGLAMGEVAVLTRKASGREKLIGRTINLASRYQALALPGQILMQSSVSTEARRFIRSDHPAAPSLELEWRCHGPYRFKGILIDIQAEAELEETSQDISKLQEAELEVWEVGVAGQEPLSAPPGTEKCWRAVLPADEDLYGWRPSIGKRIPNCSDTWTLVRRLGEGGYGEAWLAESPTGVLQVFKFCYDPDRLRSFRREIKIYDILAKDQSLRGHIARLINLNLDSPPYTLTFEYLEGGDLERWFEDQGGIGSVPLAERLRIVERVARTIAAAHRTQGGGILHKDIKPTNILMRKNNDGTFDPVVADFGIGMLAEPSEALQAGITLGSFDRTLLTDNRSARTGTIIYSPTEAQIGGRFTAKGDVYSLGVLLYQICVAELSKPLGEGWRRQIADEVLRSDIAACVDNDPENRPTAQELAERLHQLTSRRRRAARERKIRVVRRAATAIAILLLVTSVTLAVMWHRESLLRSQADEASSEANTAYLEARNLLAIGSARSLQDSDFGLAKLILRELDPERTDDDLVRQALQIVSRTGHSTELIRLRPHESEVSTVSWSPDGQHLVTGTGSGKVRLWSLSGAGSNRIIGEHGAAITSAEWDQTSRRVLTASRDGTAIAWDVFGNSDPIKFDHKGIPLSSARWNPDASQVLTAAVDGIGRIWSLNTPSEPITLGKDGGALRSALAEPGRWGPMTAEWSATGNRIATAFGGYVCVWDANRNVLLNDFLEVDGIESLAWNFAGTSLAVHRTREGAVVNWSDDLSVPRLLYSPHSLESEIDTGYADFFEWSPIDDRFAVGLQSGSVHIHHSDNSVAPTVLQWHSGHISALKWSTDGKYIAAGYADGSIVVWDTARPRSPFAAERHESVVLDLDWSPGGTMLATACADRTARVFSIDRPQQRQLIRSGNDIFVNAQWNATGDRVLTGSLRGTPVLWDPFKNVEPKRLGDAQGQVRLVAPSPTDEYLLSVHRSGGTESVRIFDSTGQLLEDRPSGHLDPISATSWSPDGTRYLTAARDGSLAIWQPLSSTPQLAIRIDHANIREPTWSPDGKSILYIHDMHNDSLFSRAVVRKAEADGEIVFQTDETLAVRDAKWNPDGSAILITTLDHQVHSIRVTGKGSSRAYEMPRVAVASWSPDGKHIAAVSDGGDVAVWSATEPSERKTLKGPYGFPVVDILWSPDSESIMLLAYAPRSGIWIHSLTTPGQPLVLADGYLVTDASWSPSGNRVLVQFSEENAQDQYLEVIELDFSRLRDSFWRYSKDYLLPEERMRFLGESDDIADIRSKTDREWLARRVNTELPEPANPLPPR